MRVPGYVISGPSAALGGSWRGTEHATGVPVLLKPVGCAPARLAAIRTFEHPHALRVRYIAAAHGGTVVVYDQPVATLADVGALSPAQQTTVALPLKDVLTAAHAAGLVHGALDDSYVCFDGTGRPLLGGLGLAIDEPVEAADDIDAVQRLLPGAGGIAAPVPLPRPHAVVAARQPRRRLGWLLLPLITVPIVVAAARSHPGVSADERPATFAAPTDWRAIVGRLDAARVVAFETHSVERLSDVDVLGSTAYQHDAAAIRALADRPVHGLRFIIDGVRVASQAASQVRLVVTDRMTGHEIGVAQVPARDARRWFVDVVLTANGWRINEVQNFVR